MATSTASEREPEYQDEVKHKTDEMSGTVIAKYPFLNSITDKLETFLDVRGVNDKIYYHTHIENWETVRKEEAL